METTNRMAAFLRGGRSNNKVRITTARSHTPSVSWKLGIDIL